MPAVLVNGIAHCLAVDAEAFVMLAKHFIPALQGKIQFHWIDSDEQIANDVFARNSAATVLTTAAETLSPF